MRYLLDTHSLLWALFRPEKLSAPARKEIRDQSNDVAVSVVAFWEISLKCSLGKLKFSGVKPEELPGASEQMGLTILPLAKGEAATFSQLPRLAHKDPFDRMIIWQAIQQNIILISADREFKAYQKHGLRIHW